MTNATDSVLPGHTARRDASLQQLREFLDQLGCEALPSDAVLEFKRSRYTHGWLLQFGSASNLTVSVLADERFPFEPISVFADPSLFRVIPHVEKDGWVCALPGQATINATQPVGVATDVLKRAYKILSASPASVQTKREFVAEFYSYWEGTVVGRTVRSLLNLGGEARGIAVWRGERFTLVAETEHEARRWLRFSQGDTKEVRAKNFTLERGLYVPLTTLPTPDRYPLTPTAAVQLAEDEGEHVGAFVRAEIDSCFDALLVAFSGTTENGLGIFAIDVRVPPPEGRGPHKPSVDRHVRGFRPRSLKNPITADAIRRRRPIEGRQVRRIDPAWVHGRDVVDATKTLLEKHVVVLGCGSLGSSVATQVAKCGVGKITLVDPDLMAAANASRHELGLDDLHRYKAAALRERLLERLPHAVAIEHHDRRWEDVAWPGGNVFADADVVVSTMGDWRTEGALNAAWIDSERPCPFVAGWTEPFAGAGHVVVLNQNTGCMACNFDEFGRPNVRVTQWPKDGALRQEPACASMFQPYGPIELGHIHSLIAHAVIDAIAADVPLERTQRIWAGQQALVQANGGTWTEEWSAAHPGRAEGGFMVERPWNPNAGCSYCGATT